MPYNFYVVTVVYLYSKTTAAVRTGETDMCQNRDVIRVTEWYWRTVQARCWQIAQCTRLSIHHQSRSYSQVSRHPIRASSFPYQSSIPALTNPASRVLSLFQMLAHHYQPFDSLLLIIVYYQLCSSDMWQASSSLARQKILILSSLNSSI